ncbi:MAG: Gfo/Idh/MocA family oxidoreductase, partial [Myxococcota bacterium]|nr:Gfo/Idh/MocA family oxidoreductase [Myxococcota bacterium]
QKARELAHDLSCQAIPVDDILYDIDAIYIPYPPAYHFAWIKRALQAGVHVLCEKPLAMNTQELNEIYALAQNKKLVVLENYMFLHHNQHQHVQTLLSQIGRIRSFRAAFAFPPFPDPNNIRYHRALGGGALLDCSGYPIQAALMYLGLDLRVESSFLHKREAKDEGHIDIFGDVTLRNPEGIPAHLHFGFDNAYQCIYEIHGSKGIIRVPKAYTPRPNVETMIELYSQQTQHIKTPAEDHFYTILQHFRSLITSGNGILHRDWQRTYHAARIQEEIRRGPSNLTILPQ